MNSELLQFISDVGVPAAIALIALYILMLSMKERRQMIEAESERLKAQQKERDADNDTVKQMLGMVAAQTAAVTKLAEAQQASADAIRAATEEHAKSREAYEAAKEHVETTTQEKTALSKQIQTATETITAGQQQVIEHLEQTVNNLVDAIKTDCTRDYTPQLTIILDILRDLNKKVTGEHPAAPSNNKPAVDEAASMKESADG